MVFSAAQLKHFRQKILDRQIELKAIEQSGNDAAATVELDQTKVGRLSRMDALQSQAMFKETNRRRQIELARLEAALLRLTSGEFGECLECGELIADARLKFDPSVTLCIHCASSHEQ